MHAFCSITSHASLTDECDEKANKVLCEIEEGEVLKAAVVRSE